ncbi:eukaryotic translation initiation factor 3 subunit G-like [Pocillopora verrucosa]|uniref:eukaryotic translation initiation factor 3 subunit G-like n=1 Tax=Pocillopora damicornis TaxID=46731 RepID=UPI000F54FDED|nr:eukaryotic translation initiation factor 3 subunit G-like [Pocillopora damicornis]XP_058969363.1 eukaryotic translation initiation factor 3 subunit G-like [Pocillopora verrucosa]
MPAIDKEADEKPSWADLVEEGEADHIPPPTEVINGDTKIVTEFKRNEEGKLLKIVRTFKIETKRVSKTIAKRKLWRKFGDAKNDGPGPNPSTTTVTDDVFLILTTNKEDLQQDNDDPLKKLGQSSQKIVQCRICKGDHWTTKCPYKDQLEVIQAQVKDDEAKSAVDAGGAVGGAGEQPQASKTGKYIAPSLREGAGNRRGETMPRSQRDETATIRVTNLSEDTRESDLMELFRPFGPISRIFLAKDKNTNQSKGFAFINFVHREDAARAIQSVQGFGYDHLILSVEWAKPSTNQQ